MIRKANRWMSMLMLLALLAGASGVLAQEDEFDWRQFEGTTIRVLWPNISWTDFILERLPEFEELTGITVNMETFEEFALRERLTIELTAGGQEIDIFGSMTIQEGYKYSQAGWYSSLDDLMNDPTVTNADFDPEDFTDGAMAISTVGGELVGVPTYSDTLIMFYRPSVLEAAGVEVPTTLDELMDAAAALHDPDNDFYGWINRGKGAAATSIFSGVLYSMGGSWQDEDGNPAMTTPEAIAAFQWWGDMLRLYGPPGALNNSWTENLTLFTSGSGALWTESGQAAATVLDPEQSQVADDAGFAVHPAGAAGSQPYAYGWIMCIPPNAPNREAAWLFIQWATNKENCLDALMLGIPAPRASAWEAPEFAESDPHPDLTEVMLASLKVATGQMNPAIVNVQPWRDIVGQVIITAIQGGDVEAAAAEAQAQLEELLADEAEMLAAQQ